MTAPSRSPSLDAIREALRRAISTSSLRAVARDVGMTAPGLQSFIDGGQPRAATARKLNEWFVRNAATHDEAGPASIDAAFAVLLAEMPENEREEARNELQEKLRELHVHAGVRPPAWCA